ncbi:MAG: FG-GAP repeat domain-containing protein [Nitrospiria bacterium]
MFSRLLCLFTAILILGCTTNRSSDISPFQEVLRGGVSYHVGLNPIFIVMADLNQDGASDLITSNSNSNNISVLLGNKDGTFKEHLMVSVGKKPRGITVGDFNGDKIPDMAIVNNETDDVTILLGKGDGTFSEGEKITLEQRSPLFIESADFNQDGKIDLVVLSRFDHVVVYLGNGDGTFKFYKIFDADDTPTALVVGDFNNDHHLDLAITNNGPVKNGIEILLGDGHGNFTVGYRHTERNFRPIALTQTDLNGDGKVDLITVDPIHHNVSVFLGNGDGTFNNGMTMSGDSEPISIVAGDFNGDHVTDIAFINNASSTLVVLFGNGDGTFKSPPARYQTKRGPFAMVKGDFNHDGLSDFAIANNGDSSVTIFLGQALQPVPVKSASLSHQPER